ncbi:MAG: dTDP-4-dehydrorhamnose 3,5-epimerase [Flavobacteriales bacterium]
MNLVQTEFQGLMIIEPNVFGDARGYFFEVFNESQFRVKSGLNVTFVQDNESMSSKDVLRGLHFQIPPKSQGKLVRVTKGAVLDVVVDLRKTQPTFGRHYKVVLSAENKRQMYIPEGFAHGFKVLEDDTIFSYKCTNYYSKEHERSLLWNDPALGIDWEIENPNISDKDKEGQLISDFTDIFF